MKTIKIANRFIGPDHEPFIIAEMSGNHNQSLERALSIVDEASKTGVHAIKLQTYTADTMTLDMENKDFFINDPESLWDQQSLYKLYQQAYTPWEWHEEIFKRAHEKSLIAFSSPFDSSAVDFLEKLNVPCYKIASFEMTDLPLISKVASKGKPMIISTGMASISEIDETINTAQKAGCHDIILLKCTSTYPSIPLHSNILTIPHLREMTQCQVGLSDHTLGCGVSVASIALGATVIEKHFTLKRSDGGVDSAFSMEPSEMELLTTEVKRAYQAMGEVTYGGRGQEEKSKVFRRSLYVVEDLKYGEVLTKDNMRVVRPGHGLAPKYYETLLGKTVNQDLKKGTPITWRIIG